MLFLISLLLHFSHVWGFLCMFSWALFCTRNFIFILDKGSSIDLSPQNLHVMELLSKVQTRLI
jgi:hypothetical protein